MLKVLEDENIRKILIKKMVEMGFGDELNEDSKFLRIKLRRLLTIHLYIRCNIYVSYDTKVEQVSGFAGVF